MMNAPTSLKAKDFASDQEVRWCPGCGDYAILKGVQKTLADIGADPAKTVFVSGIGCSSRFPYYMETYGFHTIHGRAPAFATGIKLANPDLDVWLVTGDGDGLSIGGNHMLHVLRRNVNVQIMLFNNEIYGLTKGQYSPTSRIGTLSPSTPMGSVDQPLSPVRFALGAGAGFVARAIDTALPHLTGVLTRAQTHRGASFVEIFQNCPVYNDNVFADFTKKDVAKARQLHLEHGQAMLFGDEGNMGLRQKPGAYELEVVTVGNNGITEDDVMVHDETNPVLAGMLASVSGPDFPVPIGVIYCNPGNTFDDSMVEQIQQAKDKAKTTDLNEILRTANTWTVE